MSDGDCYNGDAPKIKKSYNITAVLKRH